MRHSPKLTDHPELIPEFQVITTSQFEGFVQRLEHAARQAGDEAVREAEKVSKEEALNQRIAADANIEELLRYPAINYWYVLFALYALKAKGGGRMRKDEAEKIAIPGRETMVGKAYVARLIRALLLRSVRSGSMRWVEICSEAEVAMAETLDAWTEAFGEFQHKLEAADQRGKD
jgi:hypothetical protein